MKLLCIDAKNNVPLPVEEGVCYELLKAAYFCGYPIYFFTHAPTTPLCRTRFIEVGDICETELAKQRELQTA